MAKPRLLLATMLLACASWAQAHGLDLLAQRQGDEVSGVAMYSDQSPAAQVYVAVREAEGDPSRTLAEGKSDAAGQFRFKVPAGVAVRVFIEGEEGHRASVIPDEIAGAGPQDGGVLSLLRQDIARLEHRLWWRDVLGGIGCVIGVLGLLAFWQAHELRKGRG